MQLLTSSLEAGQDLSSEQIELAVAALTSSDVSDAEKAAFLKALRQKGETAAEIAGFAAALLTRAVPIEIDQSRITAPTIDVCGTGGDRQGFFNVSTTTMFVAAAMGMCVVKHGNRSVTSQTGAADVLEELGVRIDLSADGVQNSLRKHGVSFIFAPLFHPSIKAVAPVRKALASEGTATIFNILGPLLNPARPDYQLVGVFNPDVLERYAAALRSLGRKRAWAVHGNGTDELTLTGPSRVHEVTQEGSRAFEVDPKSLGLELCSPAELQGGDRVENAKIVLGVLDGSIRGPKRDMVLLNAAAAAVVCGTAADLSDGLVAAAEAIDSGKAAGKLEALRQG